MALTRAEIQEYLYQLSSKKGFITEQEIEKCCDENDVELFDIDKIIQFLIDRKVLIQDANQLKNSNEEEGYDRAQVDYDSIYKEVLKRYPEQKYLIAELKKTLPPQRNEWQTLVPQAKQGNVFARNRIISMYARNLFRSAYNFAISFGSDINNSFDDAIEGLIKALNSYDLTSPQPFPGYYPFYVYAAMQRNYEKINSAYEISNHHFQDMFSFLTTYKEFIEKYGIHSFLDYVPERKINELKEKNLIVYNYLMHNIEYDFNNILYDSKVEELCFFEEVREKLYHLLSVLSEREYKTLELRFGLKDGHGLTLEEIAQKYNLTRERVRQIECQALRKLRIPRGTTGLRECFENTLDDFFPRISFLIISEKKSFDENEFSDMSQ